MTSVPDRARVRLTGISSRAYEHPADRSALVALRKLSGFDVLLSKLFGLINERALRLSFLAGAVKVSERQFPHINALVRDGAYILDLPDVPDCFVIQSPIVNARAINAGTPRSISPTSVRAENSTMAPWAKLNTPEALKMRTKPRATRE